MAPAKKPRTPLLKPAERRRLARTVPEWRVRGKSLVREWTLADFDEAMALLDAVAQLARRADHHPDLHLTDYKHLRVELSSHDAGGLTERDFGLAGDIDMLPEAARTGGASRKRPKARRAVALSRPQRLRP
jgi:4a-hydroxytetrahydrobiopterin dehydratase